MKLTAAIKKAEKVTGKKVQFDTFQYSVNFGNNTISWITNNGFDGEKTITCIKTVSGTDETDTMIDYFDGVYHDNLTRALKFVGAL